MTSRPKRFVVLGALIALVVTAFFGVPAASAAVTPLLTGTATPAATVGMPIADSATLSGTSAGTGTITFSAFNSSSVKCMTQVFSSSVTVTGDGTYHSASFFGSPDTYHWYAFYSGDANNSPTGTQCLSNPAQQSVVSKASLTLTGAATAAVLLTGSIADSVTTSHGYGPAGPVTFTAFGPDDATCAGPVAFTSTVLLQPAESATTSSAPFVPTATGTYMWVAAFGGDANNLAVATPCGGSGQTSVVGLAATLTATATATAFAGTAISDTATLVRGANPTGTMTFSLYGPGDNTCGGPGLATSTAPVSGSGSYTSAPFIATTVGTYRWVASYGGDNVNHPIATACGAAGQASAVAIIFVKTTSLANGPIDLAYNGTLAAVGGKKSYTWTLSSGALPAGLTLAATGAITGIPKVTGTSIFTVRVADASRPVNIASATLSITVVPMSVSSIKLPNDPIDKIYSAKLTTSGGKPTFTWSVVSGALPAGLRLSAAGHLTGTPTVAGTSHFVVQVSDSAKFTHFASAALSITVTPMAITTTALASGKVNKAFAATLTVSGGKADYVWTVVSGALPAGLKLATSGHITGTPTASVTRTFTIRVADATKPTAQRATRTFTLTIVP